MNKKTFSRLAMLPLLALAALGAHAEDIDIYNGTTSNGPNPNVLIIVDNTSSNDAAYASVCPFTGPPGNLPNSNLLDMVYCSLYGALETVRTQPSLLGKLNIGLMSGGSGSNKGGEMYYPATSPYNLPPMDASAIDAFQNVITAGIPKATGNAKLDGDMQEAWAFYTGHTGPRSGTSYASHIGTLACQRSFIILIGAASKQGRTNTGSGFGSAAELAAAGASASQQIKINTAGTPYFGPATAEDNAWIDEWARYLNQADFNTTAGDRQNIVTYTIAAGGQVADYVQILKSTGHYGGGGSFVGSDYTSLKDALVKIFYDVQAINSVFASPGLPVSTNAQGTYLNQIFIATFRPDPNGAPRWMGNLKQYRFGVNSSNPTSPALFLADASWGPYQPKTDANSALSTAGTGFFSPTAVSFWTSKDVTTLPDSAGGFWVNNAQGSGGGYDLADGQYVEKGGVSQQIRLKYLTDTYTGASPTTARNLYTCFGGSCVGSAALSTMPFKTSNADLTAAALGISNPVSNVGVNSISRSTATGNVTLTLASTPSPAIGDATTIVVSGSAGGAYDGSLAALAPSTSGTSVTYTLPAEFPPVTATATYTATGTMAGTTAVSSLTRTSNAGMITVTATLSDPTFGSGTNVLPGETISITDTAALCTAKGYCGSGVVLSVSGSNVTYTMSETPNVYGGGGTANIGVVGSACTIKKNKTNCGSISASSTNLPSSGQTNLPGLVRGTNGALTANNVLMVNFGGGANFDGGTVPGTGTTMNITGASPSGYIGAFPVVAVGAACSVTETHTDGSTRIYTGTATSGTTVYTLCLNLGAAFAAKPAPVSGNGATVASTKATKQNAGVTRTITSLIRGASNCPTSATATATVTTSPAHGFATGDKIVISSLSPGPNESAYIGTPTITVTDSTHFTYPVTTSPACTDTTAGMSIAYQQSSGGISKASLINWVRGEDNIGDEQSPGSGVTIRPSVHGDVLHSRPAVINYGGTTGIVAFYGANDGVFRAVNANQPNNTADSTKAQGDCTASSTCAIGGIPPGGEIWGFIPSEFFPKLQRLYNNSPAVQLYNTPSALTPKFKDYFLDGPTSFYQDSANNKAYIYLSARRGGRLMYALDVSDPATPKFMWKKGCPNYSNNTGCDTGFTELGQTFSQPRVALIRGNANPVLIFGAGYDGNGYDTDGTPYAGNEDKEPQGTDTMGRGIFIVDAFTGNLLWRAGPGTSNTTCTGTPCQLQDMTYSIASDITLLDRNFDGYVDRLYATDTGGNIWRVDLEPSTSSNLPSTWQVTKLASLGGSGTGTKRKFMFSADVVPTKNFDAVLAGTGDREHPLAAHTDAMGVVNRFYMIQDRNVGMNGAALDGSGQAIQPTVVDNSAQSGAAAPSPATLFNATSATYNAASSAFNGFYLTLNQNMQSITSGSTAGEKVVNAPTTAGGYTYFGTNQPAPTLANVCTPNLGNARGYKVNFITGASSFTLFDGGGLPPSPVFGLVTVNVDGRQETLPFMLGGGSGGDPNCVGPDCKSSLGAGKLPPPPPKKKRTFWYRDVDR